MTVARESSNSEEPATEAHPVEHLPPSVVLRWAAAGTIGVLGVLLAAFGIYAASSRRRAPCSS